MSALGRILGTAAKVVGYNPVTYAPLSAAYAISHGKVGIDPTPGFSATNIARGVLGSGGNAGSGQKKPTLGASGSPSTSSSYGSYDPGASQAAAQNAALAAQLRAQVADKIRGIQQTYDALNQAVDSYTQDKANQLRQNYGTQMTGLNNQYSDTANQLAGNYQNRGLGDSSYQANAQDSATKTYKTNLDAINQAEAGDLSNLGQYAAQAHAGYNSGRQNATDIGNNLGNYGASDLQTLYNNLGGQLQSLGTERAGLGTQSQFINQLNSIAPQQNQGASQLQSQLQAVLNSSAPQFAKNAIGQGLITQATSGDPAQQSYWNQFFNQLQTTSNTGK